MRTNSLEHVSLHEERVLPTCAMALSVGMTSAMSVTPESEFVVAPAGYSLNATTPAAFARLT